MSETFAGIVEILKALVLWFLGKKDRKQEHAQQVSSAEQTLDNAVDNGETIGEISEAVEGLNKAHRSEW